MSRSLRIGLAVAGLLGFLALSVGVGRILSADSAERTAVEDLVRDEARGDVAGVVRRLHGCDPACAARTRSVVRRVAGHGRVLILRNDAATDFSPGGARGQARVAWKLGSRLPTVQCVRVERAGGVVSGLEIRLLAVSAPIGREASCPP